MSATQLPIRLPPPLRSGDRIGVAALSGPVDPERLTRGCAALEELGFEPVPASNLGSVSDQGLFAGDLGERLEGFHRLVADPSIAAIVFARGGHGVLPVLPHLDWHLMAQRPRAYVGYSDLTPLLLEIVRRLRMVSFHGPMVAADLARGLSPVERDSFLDGLAGRFPQELPLAGILGGDASAEDPPEGLLMGGCLSLLTAALGTEWALDPTGALVFWEDVGEPLYRLDRMLTQWVLSNRLKGIRGLIVGHADLAEAGRGEPPPDAVPEHERKGGCGEEPRIAARLSTWLREGPAGRLGCTVAWGLETGHRAPNRTLPLGLSARLEPEGPRLVLLPSPP